ncbi:formyl transferase [Azorhizobium doebereinerae]|uniref:formyl transferase n=1 Tax=Azorhizobium doebereinerae TaxID=281091 RepID=UPI00040D9764|nr:formyl transferase [Azorhizobium doebereinerae]
MRIAILCSDDAHHGYLVARLAERFDIAAVVVEPGDAQTRRLRRRGRYRDWLWARYHRLRRDLTGLNRYRRAYFGGGGPRPVPGAVWLETETANAPAVADLLRASRPDVTVVMGTSILKPPVLEAGRCAINIHGGYLPFYRGNHCFFFALYEERFDRIGSTIHFVDAGIDTGDIIELVVPPLHADDNAERLYCRAEKMAIDRLAEHLARLEQGRPLPRRPQAGTGRTFRTRDRHPWHDLHLWARRRLGLTRLPEAAE